MYADDWNKAAVLYSEWAIRKRYPVPENIFTPPPVWGARTSPATPTPAPAVTLPPKRRKGLCKEGLCKQRALPHPLAGGLCQTHWREKLLRRVVLSGIARRERKKALALGLGTM